MATEISLATDQIEPLASRLIAQYHQDLADANIVWLFSNAKRTREGTIRSGWGKKANPELRFAFSAVLEPGADPSIDLGPDYVITISANIWRAAGAEQRLELVDHQLCHLQRVERANKRTGKITTTWGRRGHDIEDFVAIVKRYGLQNARRKAFIMAGAQLAMFEKQPEADKPPRGRRARKTTVDGDSLVVESVVTDPPVEQTKPVDESGGATTVVVTGGAVLEAMLAEDLPEETAATKSASEVVIGSDGTPYETEELPEFDNVSPLKTREERLAALDAQDERLDRQL